jgi:hypothetical protein
VKGTSTPQFTRWHQEATKPSYTPYTCQSYTSRKNNGCCLGGIGLHCADCRRRFATLPTAPPATPLGQSSNHLRITAPCTERWGTPCAHPAALAHTALCCALCGVWDLLPVQQQPQNHGCPFSCLSAGLLLRHCASQQPVQPVAPALEVHAGAALPQGCLQLVQRTPCHGVSIAAPLLLAMLLLSCTGHQA